jgi:hypothetical protein
VVSGQTIFVKFPEETSVKLVLYVIWALFMVAALWAIIHSVKKSRAQERLIASWPKAQGRVTGSRQGWTSGVGNSSRNIRHWPTYEFVGDDGAVYTGESEVSYVNAPVPGSALEVAYNPADPHRSFQVDSPSKPLLGCIIPVLVLLCIAAFWFIDFLPVD